MDMGEKQAKEILDKIIKQIFGVDNPLSLDQFVKKFAFDVRLPQRVTDSTDGSITWASSTNPTKFKKMYNARNNEATVSDGLYATEPISDLTDLLAKWDRINYTTTERQIDSINIAESDSIHWSENIYRSQDIRRSKNIIFSDGIAESEFIAAGQRSGSNTFCVRIDDSGECSNSFNVSWSVNIVNSYFMHDCADMQDSMFCTNMKGQRFCIANMKFEEAEYRRLEKQVINWILTPA